MKLFIPKEKHPQENRVALCPQFIKKLLDLNFTVTVEAGAGIAANFSDENYLQQGAKLGTASQWSEADFVVSIGSGLEEHAQKLKAGSCLLGLLNPLGDPCQIQQLANQNVTSFALEMIPRISRAQSMDALSSQAALAGYKAVLIAANRLNKVFPMLTTAAGTLTPAKVIVLGAGVAGLMAIATARRLGAQVEAFDIRPEVKEQVESLGAKFITMKIAEKTQTEGGYAAQVSADLSTKIHQTLIEPLSKAEIVITTAQIPGKQAPLLINEEMLKRMQTASVVVDMASAQGGNCFGVKSDQEVILHDVIILGPSNLPSSLANHASQMYAKNIITFLQHICLNKTLNLDFADEIINKACVTHNGKIRSKQVIEKL